MFRESAGKSVHSSALLLHELDGLIQQIVSTNGEQQRGLLINALLRAGEIECALADLRDEAAASAIELTDASARALVRGEYIRFSAASARLQSCVLPESLTVTAPEGFAYYALDPLSYVKKLRELKLGRAAVVGIRSIGTVLSAVVAAELGCDRITVRPNGHPYDRGLELSREHREWIGKNNLATFVILDEGPGLSGSSFLSVAEALESAGIPCERIIMIGGHACDPARLVARDAAARWRRFRYEHVERDAIPPRARPFEGWDWRRELFPDGTWPPSWRQMTSPKFVANDGRSIWKFEGIGRVGDVVRARARTLADAGFAPCLIGEAHGFTQYELIQGEPLSTEDLNDAVLERIAEYLAFRSKNFSTDVQDASALEEMTRHNVAQLLGIELAGFQLPIENPIICDARLTPYEWKKSRDGALIKTDGVMHGDNHYFPGPCDLAWDVAGAIVEWKMHGQMAECFVSLCEQRIRSAIRARLDAYLLAYCAFHAGYSKMGGNALTDTEEARRFSRDFDRYIALLDRAAERFAVKRASLPA